MQHNATWHNAGFGYLGRRLQVLNGLKLMSQRPLKQFYSIACHIGTEPVAESSVYRSCYVLTCLVIPPQYNCFAFFFWYLNTWAFYVIMSWNNYFEIWDSYSNDGGNSSSLGCDSHIACRAHDVPLSCRAAKGLECVFPIWFTQCGRVWFTLAMPCCAVALRRTAWSGMAWTRHVKCESDTAALYKSNGKDPF